MTCKTKPDASCGCLTILSRRNAQIGGAMARASRAAAPSGKKAAAAAALEAYEDNLDLAVQLGWAHVDRITFEARACGHAAELCSPWAVEDIVEAHKVLHGKGARAEDSPHLHHAVTPA